MKINPIAPNKLNVLKNFKIKLNDRIKDIEELVRKYKSK